MLKFREQMAGKERGSAGVAETSLFVPTFGTFASTVAQLLSAEVVTAL